MEWIKRLLIAFTATWAGMNIMNLWFWVSFHHGTPPFDLVFTTVFMGCGPLLIAFAIAATWKRKSSAP